MRFKYRPEDFLVEEELALTLYKTGPFAVYAITKKGITTLEAQVRLAHALGIPPSVISFPALKDRKAIALQHASVPGTGPGELAGEGFTARLVGYTRRPLAPADLKGNRFTLILREIPPSDKEAIIQALRELKQQGLPNYFDRQRFGSYVPGEGFIGKKILLRDAESALKMYLTCPFPVDRTNYRRFKEKAAELWGDWETLLEEAPSPSNFRSVLTFLKDHPDQFRKALNLVTPRLLRLFLSAYQSWLWNKLAGRFLGETLTQHHIPFMSLDIAGEELPFYHSLPEELLSGLSKVRIPFFHHKVTFENPLLARIAGQILEEEGLELRDFKARILKRAYLAGGERHLLLFPREVRWDISEDEFHPGMLKLKLSFFLKPGSYATLVVKALAIRSIAVPFEPRRRNG